MTRKKKKEIAVFLLFIALMFATFAEGVIYLKGHDAVLASSSAPAASVGSAQAITPSSTTATATNPEKNPLAGGASPSVPLSVAETGTIAAMPSIAQIKTADSVPPDLSAPSSSASSSAEQASSTATSTTTAAEKLSLPYSIGTFGNVFTDGDGWTNSWGAVSQTGGVLTIGSTNTGTGGGILLAGSEQWTDYTFHATFDWSAGNSVGLIARYVDDQNYVECRYYEPQSGTLFVQLDQYVNGKLTDLADGAVPNFNGTGGANLNAAIAVFGTKGECGFGQYYITSSFADTALTAPFSGSIGFTAWDSTPGNSKIVVKNVGVADTQYDLGSSAIQTF